MSCICLRIVSFRGIERNRASSNRIFERWLFSTLVIFNRREPERIFDPDRFELRFISAEIFMPKYSDERETDANLSTRLNVAIVDVSRLKLTRLNLMNFSRRMIFRDEQTRAFFHYSWHTGCINYGTLILLISPFGLYASRMCACYSISSVSKVCAARTSTLLDKQVDKHEIIMRIEIIIGGKRWILAPQRKYWAKIFFVISQRRGDGPFLSPQFAENKFQTVFEKSATYVSFVLVANYLRNAAVENISTLARCSKPLFPVRHFAEIMALSLGRCHSRAGGIVPLITAVRTDKQWRRTMAALDRRQWILSCSLIRAGTRIVRLDECVSPCTRISSDILAN